jgi:hypothetical protein
MIISSFLYSYILRLKSVDENVNEYLWKKGVKNWFILNEEL